MPDLFFRISKYARKNNVQLIHDSVEWYSPEEYKRGRLSLEYNLKIFNNKIVIRKPWKVISISKFLEDYYYSRGLKTIRIPVIMDIYSITDYNKVRNKKNIFVYAGMPGKKDYLNTMIEGFSKLPQLYKNKFEFHIFGVDRKQLINQCGVKEENIIELKENIIIHGRVPREKTIKWIKKANYTVLLRESSLCYAKAGFPTKVVESLAYATPVICNLSSDLNDYLKDEENSIIVRDCSAEEFCKAVIKAMNQSEEKQMQMSQSARKTAEKYFDYRIYGEKIGNLLK